MALSKLFFKKPVKILLRNFIVFWVVFTLPLLSLARPALAQSTQTAKPTGAQTKSTEVLNGSVTSKYSQSPVNTSTTVSAESGKVLVCIPTPWNSCDLNPLPSIGDLVSGIFEFFVDHLLDLLQKIFLFMFMMMTGWLGFSILAFTAACGGLFDPIMNLLGSNYQDPTAVTKFNAFVVLDIGVSGVYQSLPSNGPVQTIAHAFQQNVLGIQTVSAQGEGTDAIGSGIRGIWERIRDVTLILMVLVLVVIGFMVMLRRRLDPRTVVTATNALPRIGLALLLIVFSFAISGLFIDLVFIMVGIVRNTFGGAGGVFSYVSDNLGGEFIWFPIFSAFSMSSIIDWGAVLCGGGSLPVFLIGPGLVGVLILIMVLEIFIRLLLIIVGIYLFWILLKTFASMLLFTIFSPIFFLLGAIPGFEGVTSNWFKRMLVYALVFPVVLIFIHLAVTLLQQANPLAGLFGFNDNPNAPPPIDSNILNVPYLLAIGVIFFATKVPQFLEKMFKIDGTDIRGGLGMSALAMPVTVPYKVGTTLNKAAGPVTALTTAAVQRGGFVGKLASPVHNTMRTMVDHTKGYVPTSQELSSGQIEYKLASGRRSAHYKDAAAVAKEQFITEHLATQPGASRGQAEQKWFEHLQSNYNVAQNPNLAPKQRGAETLTEVDRLVKDHESKLNAQGLPPAEVANKLREFISNGYQ